MLTKRTNILLEPETYNYLASLAQRENASLAKIIRTAINQVYKKREKMVSLKKLAEDVVGALDLAKYSEWSSRKKIIVWQRKIRSEKGV